MTPRVFIDDRAGSKQLVRLPPLNKIAELVRLRSGDVCFSGHGPDGAVLVGIEVKGIRDLISSIETGRLQATQLPRLLADYDVPWLAVYGGYRPRYDGKLQIKIGRSWRMYKIGKRTVPYSYVEGLLLDLVATGVSVKHVETEKDIARWLSVLARWWAKPWQQHQGLKVLASSRNVSLMPDMDARTLLRAKVATQLPAIGYKRACKVAAHFGSVREMVAAGADEWAGIDGVGKAAAKAVEEAVR